MAWRSGYGTGRPRGRGGCCGRGRRGGEKVYAVGQSAIERIGGEQELDVGGVGDAVAVEVAVDPAVGGGAGAFVEFVGTEENLDIAGIDFAVEVDVAHQHRADEDLVGGQG